MVSIGSGEPSNEPTRFHDDGLKDGAVTTLAQRMQTNAVTTLDDPRHQSACTDKARFNQWRHPILSSGDFDDLATRQYGPTHYGNVGTDVDVHTFEIPVELVTGRRYEPAWSE